MSSNDLSVDVLIVGAGPAGLSCALHLQRDGAARQVLVLEKSAQLGGHLLSGAVLRADPLRRLLTPEEMTSVPLGPLVGNESLYFLRPRRAWRLPWIPPPMRMRGLPLVSASALGRALGQMARARGVEILTSQTADQLLWSGDRVIGVRSGGEQIRAAVTVLAEGPAGRLTREVLERHPAIAGRNLQTHGLGLKEIIEIPPCPEMVGTAWHTFGFPLAASVYGGGFLYQFDEHHVALGLVMALDYTDPLLQVHESFRRWKRHPLVQRRIAGGKVMEYGARLVPEGGWHSLPQLQAPGVLLIGDTAGLVDAMELKGLHLAIESGMAAAEAIRGGQPLRLEHIPSAQVLRRTANFRASFRGGLGAGLGATALIWLTRGRLPFGCLPQRNERTCLHPLRRPVALPVSPPDQGPVDLGVDSDLFHARLRHHPAAEHIEIRDPALCRECFERFAAPCTRFCPAGVYEADSGAAAIRVRAENCLQCRCCTLKCPWDNILWETPHYGVGPDHRQM